MITKIQKWGNSQGLRLSKTLLSDADIAVGRLLSSGQRLVDHPLPPPCSPCPCAPPMNAGDVAGGGHHRNLPRPRLMFRSRVPLRSLGSAQSPSDEMHYLSSRSYLS